MNPVAGTATTEVPVTDSQHADGPATSVDRAIFALALAGSLVAIVAAAIRGLLTDWVPIGDSAYFVIRSRDVLTEHHPLLGAWSSGSTSIGAFVNNLGPLQFDLLAPFTRLGPAGGTTVGVAAVNAASVIALGLVVRRLAGTAAACVALAAAASVTWSMGSALLIEPQQHPAMILPFLCYLTAVWAVAAGEPWALPVAVFSGSVVLQTHLSYAALVVLLAALGLGACAVGAIAARRRAGDQWLARRASRRRWGVVAAVVWVACWTQPLVDQFWGRGNMSSLLGAAGAGRGPGYGRGARMVGAVVAWPPWWARNSYRTFSPAAGLPSLAAAAAALVGLGLLLALVGLSARRRHHRIGAVGVLTSLVALAGALFTAARLPVASYGLSSANYRWLWAIGAFWVTAAIAALLPPARRIHRRWTIGVALVAVTFGVAGVPASNQGDPNRPAQIEISNDLTAQLSVLAVRDIGPVLIDRSNSPFAEPYSYAVVAELQTLRIDFRFVSSAEEYRFGDGRLMVGDERQLLTLQYGARAAVTPPGSERVAYVANLTEAERAELEERKADVVDGLAEGTAVVDLATAEAANDTTYARTRAAIDRRPDISTDFLALELAALQDQGHVDAPAPFLDDLGRFQELVAQRAGAVAVVITPID
ncbi:MAG: hypothetical protein H0U21_14955 [Acidimicrobiia bacterium]|nr:hypothetical protein [Acidimicrobiia bacterium]